MSIKRNYTVEEGVDDIKVRYNSDSSLFTIAQSQKHGLPLLILVSRQQAQDLISALQKVMDVVDQEEAKREGKGQQ